MVLKLCAAGSRPAGTQQPMSGMGHLQSGQGGKKRVSLEAVAASCHESTFSSASPAAVICLASCFLLSEAANTDAAKVFRIVSASPSRRADAMADEAGEVAPLGA